MSAAIAHRGPDDVGAWTADHVALLHRRLSIIDLSAAGHQPMHSHCGRYVMVYNGEIYNYLELRRELEQSGVSFHSNSDSEVLLAAFVLHGPSCLQKFNGMWALAIWDRVTSRLFVSRDRFGEKPFYYAVNEGQFVFASEIKALLTTGLVSRTPNPEMVADFCAERVSDHTSHTFFKDVSQLPPGAWAWWREGRLEVHRYWELPLDATAPPRSDIVEEIRALLEDSVRLRLRSDAPVGALLSGGVDSSGITCLAASLVSGRFNAFSTIDEHPPEEAAGIGLVLQANPNIDAYRDQPDATCLDDELSACLWHQEEPFADGSMLAHFRLMRLARQSGVRVLLTGQAADEVFAGYPGHLAIHLGGLIRQRRWSDAIRFRRAWSGSGPTPPVAGIAGHALPPWLSATIRHTRVKRSVDWLIEDCSHVTDIGRGYAGSSGDPLAASLRASLTQRTLPGFLHYEDRNSMAFGVETRIPFLDHRLVSKVLPLPGAIKLAGARTKALLRQALAGRVPPAILERPLKQGYPAPLSRWLRSASRAQELDRVARVVACPLIRFPKWWDRYQRFQRGDDEELPAVWRGVILSQWHARFMRGAP
jgi:asparagine synthase (glutamine-hydrolysing)